MDGSSSEISAITTEALFNTLKLAPMRLGLPDHPTPTSYHLAHNYYPTSVDICKKVLSASITVKKSTRNIGSIIPVWEMLFGKGLFMLPPKDWKRVHTISMRSFGSAQTKGF